MDFTFTQQLMASGLTLHHARIYELLIKNGGLRASSVVRMLGGTLSRPLVYLVLSELTELGLVLKNDVDTKVTRFIPAHPSKLQEIAERKRLAVEAMEETAALLIPKMVSTYTLVSNKPGVRYFEGRRGLEAVLADSLTTKTPIYSYTDVEQIEKHYKREVDAYVALREKRKIMKKLILDDTPFVRAFYRGSEETQSEVRLIPKQENPYTVAIQIYDNKISYLTLDPGKEVAIIIEHEKIASLQRHLFEVLYDRAAPLYAGSSSGTSVSDTSV